jgi:hypothetical protein
MNANVKPGGGVEFMARMCTGCQTTYLGGTTVTFPVYLRLSRTGSTVLGEVSKDGSSFTRVEAIDTTLPATLEFGFCCHESRLEPRDDGGV